jgi:hypothetical protein
VDLEREAQRLERSLQGARARAGDAAAARIDAIAQALVLGQVAGVLREGEPEKRKRVVRCFLQGIRIEKATRQAVLRWYRLPRGSFVKLVELRGAELDPSPAMAAAEEQILPLPARRRSKPPSQCGPRQSAVIGVPTGEVTVQSTLHRATIVALS